MLFYQTYSKKEYSFGQQAFWFAVSDDVSELFNSTGGTSINIFQLESIKEDLKLDELRFAIDEISFTIDEASCISDDEKNALAFCLEATDIKALRYVGIFFGSTPLLADKKFIGKVKQCKTPYGNGKAGKRVANILSKIKCSTSHIVSKSVRGPFYSMIITINTNSDFGAIYRIQIFWVI